MSFIQVIVALRKDKIVTFVWLYMVVIFEMFYEAYPNVFWEEQFCFVNL